MINITPTHVGNIIETGDGRDAVFIAGRTGGELGGAIGAARDKVRIAAIDADADRRASLPCGLQDRAAAERDALAESINAARVVFPALSLVDRFGCGEPCAHDDVAYVSPSAAECQACGDLVAGSPARSMVFIVDAESGTFATDSLLTAVEVALDAVGLDRNDRAVVAMRLFDAGITEGPRALRAGDRAADIGAFESVHAYARANGVDVDDVQRIDDVPGDLAARAERDALAE